ncbi:MAG: plasmid recombination protein [Pararhodobacter sp.]|nr:plasmid recombination protein [Pararhodobacter sp.]
MSYRIVLRLKGLFPNQLGRVQMHAKRAGGDLDHIDHSKTSLNEILIGPQDWVDQLRTRIARASEANLEEEVAACLIRKRPKDARMATTRGLKEPWKFTRHGPLREGILTVHHEWFGGAGAARWDPEKVAKFQNRAVAFLQECYGDICVHARIDMDEEAPHVHFVLAPWHEKISASRGRQQLLQPSSHPLIASYELAQDVVADFFADLGILRGERRAEAIRQARADALPLPSQPVHIPPADWRRQQALNLAKARKAVEAEKATVSERETRIAGLERGLESIAKCEIIYVAPTREHPERLERGVAFPKDRAIRDELKQALHTSHTDVMKYARALSGAAQSLLAEKQTALQRDREALNQAQQNFLDQKEQILVARQKVTRRAQGIAADLRRIAEMRQTLGLEGHPEFDALMARYAQTRPTGGRKIAAP